MFTDVWMLADSTELATHTVWKEEENEDIVSSDGTSWCWDRSNFVSLCPSFSMWMRNQKVNRLILPSNDLITTDDGHWTTCVISRMTPLEAGWASCSPWGAWASWAPGGQTWLCSPYSIWPIKWNYWYYWPIRWVLLVLNNWQITERHY